MRIAQVKKTVINPGTQNKATAFVSVESLQSILNLPAAVLGVFEDPSRNQLGIVLEHPDFPESQEGCYLPEVNLEINSVSTTITDMNGFCIA